MTCTHAEPDEPVNRQQNTTANHQQLLDTIFAGESWQTIQGGSSDERAEKCAELFRKTTNAKWGTQIWMHDHGRVRYFLLHLTNHPEGRKLMKECIWKSCPDGGYTASKSDNPKQLRIQQQPDLVPLQNWILTQLQNGPKSWKQLADLLQEELWLEKQLNDTLRTLRNEGQIEAKGVFGQNQNPLITLV
jgi:hypothetical protein